MSQGWTYADLRAVQELEHHPGWEAVKRVLREEIDVFVGQLKRATPTDAPEVAKLQKEITVREKMLLKPEVIARNIREALGEK